MYSLAKHKVQKRFKSEAYTRLSKDLRELCGTYRLDTVQNKNRKFNSKHKVWMSRTDFHAKQYYDLQGFHK